MSFWQFGLWHVGWTIIVTLILLLLKVVFRLSEHPK